MEDYISKPTFSNEEKEEPKNEDNEDIEAPPSIAQSQSSVSSQPNINNPYNESFNYTPEFSNEGFESVDNPNQLKLKSTIPIINNNPPNEYNYKNNIIQPKDNMNQEYYGLHEYQENPHYPHFPHHPHFNGFPHHFPPHWPFPPHFINGPHGPHGPMEPIPPDGFKDFPHGPHFHGFGHHFHGPHGPHDHHFWPHGPHEEHPLPHGPHGEHPWPPHGWHHHGHYHGPHFHHHGHGPHFQDIPNNNININNIQKENDNK